MKLMPPLWLRYPHIPEGSIGWRMGYGEAYAHDFYKWFYSLTDQEKADYRKKFPEPVCWGTTEWRLLRHEKFWTYNWDVKQLDDYCIDTILEEWNAGIRREILFFWGHHPDKKGGVNKSCFSQWYLRSFDVGHLTYCCMEQYMMSKKAELFGDMEIRDRIMAADQQAEIKNLGRKVRNFDEQVWNRFKLPIVLTGNYYKFSQHADLRRFLMGTGEALLVEASPYDQIWGIGMQANDPDAQNPALWRGSNLLGFALMKVRDELKRIRKYENELEIL